MTAADQPDETVRERLVEAHLLDEFALAANAKDHSRMADILGRIDVPTETAEAIAADPQHYGFDQ